MTTEAATGVRLQALSAAGQAEVRELATRAAAAATALRVAAMLDPRPVVHVCTWCPNAKERAAEAERAGQEVRRTICEPCRQRIRTEALTRRTAIAAALISATGPMRPAQEDVSSIACRIDRELVAITEGEIPR